MPGFMSLMAVIRQTAVPFVYDYIIDFPFFHIFHHFLFPLYHKNTRYVRKLFVKC